MVINSPDCHIPQHVFLKSLPHETAGSWLALCRKLLWYIQQGSAIDSWQKRSAQKHNQKKQLRNPLSSEVGENLFTVTSLSSAVHIHTLSCAWALGRGHCAWQYWESKHFQHIDFLQCHRKDRIYLSCLSFPSVIKIQIWQTKRKPDRTKTAKPKPRGQAMEFCVHYTLKHSRYCKIKNFFFTVDWSTECTYYAWGSQSNS